MKRLTNILAPVLHDALFKPWHVLPTLCCFVVVGLGGNIGRSSAAPVTLTLGTASSSDDATEVLVTSGEGTVTVRTTSPTGSGSNVGSIAGDSTSASVRMAGTPDHVYQIQASTDLAKWVNLGWARAAANGLVEFTDFDTVTHPRRHYRIGQGRLPSAKIAVFSDPHYMAPGLVIADGVCVLGGVSENCGMFSPWCRGWQPVVCDIIVTMLEVPETWPSSDNDHDIIVAHPLWRRPEAVAFWALNQAVSAGHTGSRQPGSP